MLYSTVDSTFFFLFPFIVFFLFQVCIIGDSVGSILAFDSLIDQNNKNVTDHAHSDVTASADSIDLLGASSEPHPSRDVNKNSCQSGSERKHSNVLELQMANESKHTDHLTANNVSGKTPEKTKVPTSPGNTHNTSTNVTFTLHPQPVSGSGSRRASNISDGSSRSSREENLGQQRLDFEVSDLFMLGSPLAMVLAYRRIQGDPNSGKP